MKRAMLALAVLGACSTTTPPPPDAQWWRDPRLNEALKLTDEQLASLDRLDSAELDRLREAASAATRDFHTALATAHPSDADLAAAAQRVRSARDAALAAELRLLAAERAILTQPQWEALEDQLRAREEGWRGTDYPRHGTYPRGGWRPGWGVGRWP